MLGTKLVCDEIQCILLIVMICAAAASFLASLEDCEYSVSISSKPTMT